MTSAAAKREEIQLKLQELRERREREQAAFDAVAAAHPELSAPEIAALAQQQAAAAVAAQSLTVNGEEVRVGDRVTVKDDLHLLHRADRGYFGPDVLKPVYLGERGEVARVMTSFQGKPAVELRFADGVTKVFFVECIQTDAARGRAGASAVARNPASGAARVDLADVPVFVPPGKAQATPPKAEAQPGWGQLTMPHRRPAVGQASGAASSAATQPPPPPPTAVAALCPRTPPPVVATAKPQTLSSPPAKKGGDTHSGAAPPSPAAVTSPIRKEVPAKVRRASSSAAREASSASSPSSPAAVPIMKRPAAASAAAAAHESDADERDAPSSHVVNRGLWRASGAEVNGEDASDERHATVDSAKEESRHAATAAEAELAVDTDECQLPQGCATTYQAKYALQDDTSRIPRRQSATAAATSGTRTCWVCGLTSADATLSEPVRVAFNSQCTAMFSLFAVLTRKLQWDKVQCTASRLFTDKGTEVKTAGAVRDGMRLVATTGCVYRPAAHAEAFSTVPDAQPAAAAASTTRPSEPPKKAEPPTSPPAAKRTPMVLQRKASVGAAGSPSGPAAAAAVSPKHSTQPGSAASSPSAWSKPRHIRVYENGLYDDNIYRTVTVRPTYKTLVALKTTITRELQWRDGKKVDLLYDACGAEIVDLAAICDGDVVVASAGDRFVIPYPNTPMHMEAMKLSERLDPSRKV